MNVTRRMTADPITATPEMTHRDAVGLMSDHGIRRLPVVDTNGKLIGIVSQTDILSTQPSQATSLSVYEIYTLMDKLTVEQIMSKPVVAVSEECSLAYAARIMLDRKIGALPVVSGDKLTGIITETDIFSTFVEVLGGGEPGMRMDVRVLDRKGVLASVADVVAKAGGNIVAVTTFHGEDSEHVILSIKERGANEDELQSGLKALDGVEIVEFLPNRESCMVEFG